MSYLEITDVSLPSGSIVTPAVHNANSVTTDTNPGPSQAQSTSPGHTVQNAVKQTASRPTTARAAAVTAVYVEQTVKKRRAATVIVSGLPIVSSATDVQQFSSLCQTELGIQQPDIVTAKRLGSVRPGRVQPLLVALRTDDAASHILSRARLLRQSGDANTKNNIYINPNLTRAEATAAYLLRQQRRRPEAAVAAAHKLTWYKRQLDAEVYTNLNANNAAPYQPQQ